MPKAAARLSPDDWGFAPSINEAALHLARLGWVHTVSVAVLRPHFSHGISELREMQKAGCVRVALHFDLDFPERSLPTFSRLSGKGVAAELDRQIDFFRASGLRLDSLNGHRHVHLFPAVARRVVATGLPLRRMFDTSHWPSFAMGCWTANRYRAPWESSGYLRGGDLKSREAFFAKVFAPQFSQVICHPAVRDDFNEVQMVDPLRLARVEEYRWTLSFLGAPSASAPHSPFVGDHP